VFFGTRKLSMFLSSSHDAKETFSGTASIFLAMNNEDRNNPWQPEEEENRVADHEVVSGIDWRLVGSDSGQV
jgi:hypothetical protein